jgi:ribose-phosphate pyrophosphokinase
MANLPPILLKTEEDNEVYKSFVFHGGEQHFALKPDALGSEATITLQMQRFNLLLLTIAVDAIRRTRPDIGIQLYLPYFPAARQDRVCNEGEALTVKVYTSLINSIGFDKVIIADAHSDVAPALLDRCKNIPHGTLYNNEGKTFEVLAEWIEKQLEPTGMQGFVVAPDAGASKKVLNACSRLDPAIKDYVAFAQGSKIRDVKTGALGGFDVNCKDFLCCDVLIMDDINCNGGTFIGLAKRLKALNAGEITLFTTHTDHVAGIENVLKSGVIDSVITTNSQGNYTEKALSLFTKNRKLKVYDIFI